MKLPYALRQALTVARRDFIATVFTPAFLVFLLLPIFMSSLGAIGGISAASVAGGAQAKARVVAIASSTDGAALIAADVQMRAAMAGGDPSDAPAPVRIDQPGPNPEAQARALFSARDVDVRAVMFGPLDHPTILEGGGERSARYLAQLAEESLRNRKLGGTQALSRPTIKSVARASTSIGGRNRLAFISILGLFMIGIMLTSQSIGTMAEERNNKVIEILAASAPLESVFLGKLIGMFGSALLFLGFWGTILTSAAQHLPPGIARVFSDVGPAVGTPAFPLLFLAYFVMSYLLLGALFLSVGAQASTPREIQLLSLPITLLQVAMFALSSAGAANPTSTLALVTQVVPFSSPFAMIARAAEVPGIWPHLIALAWQALWVALTITFGARWFRRGVLQSGSAKLRFGRAK